MKGSELVGRANIGYDGEIGLSDGENEQDESGQGGDEGPRRVEIGILEARPLHVPVIVVVMVDLVEQIREVAEVDVERDVLAKVVDESRQFSIGAEVILHDVLIDEILHILGRVDQAVQQSRVSRHVLRAASVALLVRHAV